MNYVLTFMHSVGTDYLGDGGTFTFRPGDAVQCTNISIVDDDVLEQLEEGFLISVDALTGGIFDRVTFTPGSTITIVDDDGKLYVNNSTPSVSFCAIIFN